MVYYKSNNNIQRYCREYIDGLLLSDGSISSQNLSTGRYQQNCKYIDWLEVIKEYFDNYNICCRIDNGRWYSCEGYSMWDTVKSFSYKLTTLFYVEFKEERDRWYKSFLYEDNDGSTSFRYKKIVPDGLRLTPECVMN